MQELFLNKNVVKKCLGIKYLLWQVMSFCVKRYDYKLCLIHFKKVQVINKEYIEYIVSKVNYAVVKWFC